jgi:hypothetical protein
MILGTFIFNSKKFSIYNNSIPPFKSYDNKIKSIKDYESLINSLVIKKGETVNNDKLFAYVFNLLKKINIFAPSALEELIIYNNEFFTLEDFIVQHYHLIIYSYFKSYNYHLENLTKLSSIFCTSNLVNFIYYLGEEIRKNYMYLNVLNLNSKVIKYIQIFPILFVAKNNFLLLSIPENRLKKELETFSKPIILPYFENEDINNDLTSSEDLFKFHNIIKRIFFTNHFFIKTPYLIALYIGLLQEHGKNTEDLKEEKVYIYKYKKDIYFNYKINLSINKEVAENIILITADFYEFLLNWIKSNLKIKSGNLNNEMLLSIILKLVSLFLTNLIKSILKEVFSINIK